MQFLKRFLFSFAVFLGLLGASVALAAWSGPSSGPPNGNVAAPLNISATDQTKTGYLASSDSFIAPNVTASQFCISTSCISNWGSVASQWTDGAAGDIYYGSGSVGIGPSLTNPTHTLEVNGSLAAKYGTNGLYSSSGTASAFGSTIWSMDTAFQGDAAGTYATPTSYGLAWLRASNTNADSTIGEGLYGYRNNILEFALGAFGGRVTGTFTADGNVTAPGFCIGSDCKTSWDAVSTPSQWKTNGSNIYYNGGNVGIGTSNPSVAALQVVGSLYASEQHLGRPSDSAAAPSFSWNGDLDAGMFRAAANTIGFSTAGVERMRINASGNVGISAGATPANPIYPLDVIGTVRATSFIYTSDARLKSDVQTLGGALSKVLALRGVTFVWKDGTPRAGQADIGLIAQEVEKIEPGLVQTGTDGYKAVDYVRVVPLLVNAIHEQQAQLEAQQKQLDALTARLDALAR